MRASEIIEHRGCYCGKVKLPRKFSRLNKSGRTLEYNRVRQCKCVLLRMIVDPNIEIKEKPSAQKS